MRYLVVKNEPAKPAMVFGPFASKFAAAAKARFVQTHNRNLAKVRILDGKAQDGEPVAYELVLGGLIPVKLRGRTRSVLDVVA